nr:DNA cytosine methyltransferase [Paracoccus contaminans]
MPNHASTALCHPLEVRALTLREYAAIQEFPPGWHLGGTVAQGYARIGNAVPVRLGMVAGGVIADALDRLNGTESRLSRAPADYRVIYIQSHVWTRQLFKAGKTFVWEDAADNSKKSYEAPQTLRRSRAIR